MPCIRVNSPRLHSHAKFIIRLTNLAALTDKIDRPDNPLLSVAVFERQLDGLHLVAAETKADIGCRAEVIARCKHAAHDGFLVAAHSR